MAWILMLIPDADVKFEKTVWLKLSIEALLSMRLLVNYSPEILLQCGHSLSLEHLESGFFVHIYLR